MNRSSKYVLIIFILIYLLHNRGYIFTRSADAAWAFHTSQTILLKHTYSLDSYDYYGRVIHTEKGNYSVYPIGRFIIYFPPILMGILISVVTGIKFLPTAQFIASLIVPVSSAVTIYIIYKLFCMLYPKKNNIPAVFISGIGSLFFLYSRNTQIENLQTLFFIASFYLLFKSRNKEDHSEIKTNKHIILAGLLFSFACSIKLYSLIVIPAYWIYIALAYEDRIKKNIIFCIPVFIYYIIQIYIFVHYFGWGRFLGEKNSYSFLFHPYGITILGIAAKLLIGPFRGIILYAFPCILGFIISVKTFKSKYPKELIFIMSFSLILFIYIIYANWVMAPCYGPRYLIPIMVFLSITVCSISNKHIIRTLLLVTILFTIIHAPYLILRENQWTDIVLDKGQYHPYEKFIAENNNFKFSEIYGNWDLLIKNKNILITDKNGQKQKILDKPAFSAWYMLLPAHISICVVIVMISLIAYYLIILFKSINQMKD